jgi:hypothetical protein
MYWRINTASEPDVNLCAFNSLGVEGVLCSTRELLLSLGGWMLRCSFCLFSAGLKFSSSSRPRFVAVVKGRRGCVEDSEKEV